MKHKEKTQSFGIEERSSEGCAICEESGDMWCGVRVTSVARAPWVCGKCVWLLFEVAEDGVA